MRTRIVINPSEAPSEQIVERYRHCSHMHCALPRDEADITIAAICDLLRPYEFDTIAFRGISGTIIAPIVAHLMKKEMILVRKNRGENSASGRWAEGYVQAERYIIIDDLICSGNSVVDTIFAVKSFTKDRAKLIAVCLYDEVTPGFIDPSRTDALITRAHKLYKDQVEYYAAWLPRLGRLDGI